MEMVLGMDAQTQNGTGRLEHDFINMRRESARVLVQVASVCDHQVRRMALNNSPDDVAYGSSLSNDRAVWRVGTLVHFGLRKLRCKMLKRMLVTRTTNVAWHCRYKAKLAS